MAHPVPTKAFLFLFFFTLRVNPLTSDNYTPISQVCILRY